MEGRGLKESTFKFSNLFMLLMMLGRLLLHSPILTTIMTSGNLTFYKSHSNIPQSLSGRKANESYQICGKETCDHNLIVMVNRRPRLNLGSNSGPDPLRSSKKKAGRKSSQFVFILSIYYSPTILPLQAPSTPLL